MPIHRRIRPSADHVTGLHRLCRAAHRPHRPIPPPAAAPTDRPPRGPAPMSRTPPAADRQVTRNPRRRRGLGTLAEIR